MSVEVPWRQRSQSEDRRPRLPPATKKEEEAIWKKHGIQLLKKDKSKNRPELQDSQPASGNIVPWKMGADTLKKTAKQHKPLIDSVTIVEKIPWKSGIENLKKAKREPSLTEDGIQTNLEVCSAKNTASEPEWKSGTMLLRKASQTPTKNPEESTSEAVPVERKQDLKPGFQSRSRSPKPSVVEEPTPDVLLKCTPQKPKSSEPEETQLSLKKIPPKIETITPSKRVSLTPTPTKEAEPAKSTRIEGNQELTLMKTNQNRTTALSSDKILKSKKDQKLEVAQLEKPKLAIKEIPSLAEKTNTDEKVITTVHQILKPHGDKLGQSELVVDGSSMHDLPIPLTAIGQNIITSKELSDITSSETIQSKPDPITESDKSELEVKEVPDVKPPWRKPKASTSMVLPVVSQNDEPQATLKVVDTKEIVTLDLLPVQNKTVLEVTSDSKASIDIRALSDLNKTVQTSKTHSKYEKQELLEKTLQPEQPKEMVEKEATTSPVPKKEEKPIESEEKSKTALDSKKQLKTLGQEEEQVKGLKQSKQSEAKESMTTILKPILKLETEAKTVEETHKTPWRSKKQPKVEERLPEVQLKKAPQSEPSEENLPIGVNLKPVPKKEAEKTGAKKDILKPVPKIDEETAPVILEKIQKTSKEHDNDQKSSSEMSLKQIPQRELPEDDDKEAGFKRISERKEVSVEQTILNQTIEKQMEPVIPVQTSTAPWRSKKQPIIEEKLPEMQLKKTPQSKPPEEKPLERVSLKPVLKDIKQKSTVEKTSLEPVLPKKKDEADSEEITKDSQSSKVQPKAINKHPKVPSPKSPQSKPSEEVSLEDETQQPILVSESNLSETPKEGESHPPLIEKTEVPVEQIVLNQTIEKQMEPVIPVQTSTAPWRSKKQPVVEEKLPEVQLKKTPQSKPPEEKPLEGVSLKPVLKDIKQKSPVGKTSLEPVLPKKKDEADSEEITKDTQSSKVQPKAINKQPEVSSPKSPQSKPSEEVKPEDQPQQPILVSESDLSEIPKEGVSHPPLIEKTEVPVEQIVLNQTIEKQMEPVIPVQTSTAPWRSKKQPVVEEKLLEVQLKKTPQSKPPGEKPLEGVSLKPVLKDIKQMSPVEKTSLEPVLPKKQNETDLKEMTKDSLSSRVQPKATKKQPEAHLKKRILQSKPSEEVSTSDANLKSAEKIPTAEVSSEPIPTIKSKGTPIGVTSMKLMLDKEKGDIVQEDTNKTETPKNSISENKALSEVVLKKKHPVELPDDLSIERVDLKTVSKNEKEETSIKESGLEPLSQKKKKQYDTKVKSKIPLKTEGDCSETLLKRISDSKPLEENVSEVMDLKLIPKKEREDCPAELTNLDTIPKDKKENVTLKESHRTPQSPKIHALNEDIPKVVLKKIRKSEPPEEIHAESVSLQPVSKKKKEEIKSNETNLELNTENEKKRVDSKETMKSPQRSKDQPIVEDERPENQLKEIPQSKPSEDTPNEELSLTATPRKDTEETSVELASLKPILEQEKEEIVPRESNKIIIGSEKYPEDVTEVQLNKTPQTKTQMKTSKENLSLKPVPVKEKEDIPVEKTSLEPIPKKEKERTDSKGAKSKKVPEKEKEMISSEETCSTLVFQTQKDHIVPSENYEASQPSKELAIADEKQPGVQLKKTPQLKPSKEIPTESVSLKQKCDEEKILAEESSLKIASQKKEEADTRVTISSYRSKKQPKVKEERPEILLKKTPQSKPSEEAPNEKVSLKPLPKKELKITLLSKKETAIPEEIRFRQSNSENQPEAEEDKPVHKTEYTQQLEQFDEIPMEKLESEPIFVEEKEELREVVETSVPPIPSKTQHRSQLHLPVVQLEKPLQSEHSNNIPEEVNKVQSCSEKPSTVEESPIVQSEKISVQEEVSILEEVNKTENLIKLHDRQKAEIPIEQAGLNLMLEKGKVLPEEKVKIVSRPKKQPGNEERLPVMQSKNIPQSKRPEEVSKMKMKLKTNSKKTIISTKAKESIEESLDTSQSSAELECEKLQSPSISVASIKLKPLLDDVTDAKNAPVPETAIEPENMPSETQVTIISDKNVTQTFERVDYSFDVSDSKRELMIPTTRDDGNLSETEASTFETVESTVVEVSDEREPESQDIPFMKIKQRIMKKAILATSPRYIAPSFKKKLQPLTSRPGKKIRLNCVFEGEPIPTITWYCNEVLIHPNEHWAITTQGDSSVLEICNVTLEDSGIYTCRAVNEAGSATTSANVIVIGTNFLF